MKAKTKTSHPTNITSSTTSEPPPLQPPLTVEELEQCFPAAVRSECQRFLQSFHHHHQSSSSTSTSATLCKERLQAYLAWRELHSLDINGGNQETSKKDSSGEDVLSDAQHWENASRRSIEHQSRVSSKVVVSGGFNPEKGQDASHNNDCHNKKLGSKNATKVETIPQILFSHALSPSSSSAAAAAALTEKMSSCSISNVVEKEKDEHHHTHHTHCYLRDRQGYRILHHLPARIDYHSFSQHRDAVEIYVTALALYLDAILDRWSDEQVTLLIDVRPGKGWPNVAAIQLISFIRQVAQALYELFPSRLHRCVLYPVPRAAVYIWKILRNWMDPSLTQLVVLIAGRADLESPPPNDKLEEYIDPEGLRLLEEARLAAFSTEID